MVRIALNNLCLDRGEPLPEKEEDHPLTVTSPVNFEQQVPVIHTTRRHNQGSHVQHRSGVQAGTDLGTVV